VGNAGFVVMRRTKSEKGKNSYKTLCGTKRRLRREVRRGGRGGGIPIRSRDRGKVLPVIRAGPNNRVGRTHGRGKATFLERKRQGKKPKTLRKRKRTYAGLDQKGVKFL